MKATHLILSLGIVACTAIAWFVLGSAIESRTLQSTTTMQQEVEGVWGPALVQKHPHAWFASPNVASGRAMVLPSESRVGIDLLSEPKRRGLIWHQTYLGAFSGDYVFTNPTRIPQTLFLEIPLPEKASGLRDFEFVVNGQAEGERRPLRANGHIKHAELVPAGGTVSVRLAYRANGTGSWSYDFPDPGRISGFSLGMTTNFEDINFPVGTASPTARKLDGEAWDLSWDYPDVLSAPNIGMDMPKTLNAGPVAERIAFFAPVSLLFFVTVLLLIASLKGVTLHPMHIFFVSAGFFGFHLLFAYLVDLMSLYLSFGVATVVSLVLVCGYLRAVGGAKLLKVALPAQVAYLILFSFSFFFDGLTGIVLSVVSVGTLALLMALTAKVDWNRVFVGRRAGRVAPVPPELKPGVSEA
ncbi:MAG: hypothetical protein AAGB14_02050 [Verrucomicrobiota bacterium]